MPQTTPESSGDTPASSAGINISDAVSILSARKGEPKQPTENACPCHNHAPEGGKTMGQTIDLLKESSDNVETDKTSNAQSLEESRQELERERSERNAKIREHLKSMSVAQLLNAALEVQRERVVTYRDYDRGLEAVLETGNMTHYPNVCANATASFSVLSDTINGIKACLKQKELTDLLGTLQKHEAEKLSLTAALHLERLRERNEELNDDANIAVSRRLLQDGVSSLRAKMGTCVEAINEVLEELRYALAEQEEANNCVSE